MPGLLALPAPASEEDKVSVVVCGIDLRRRQLEPAGHAFHTAHEKPVIDAKGGKKRKEEKKEQSDDEGQASQSWRRKKKEGGDKRANGLKLSPHLQGVDLYALLDVQEAASAEQIKKQYRKLALQHHPDKHGGPGDAPAGDEKKGLSDKDMLFVKIQEAYEVLSDEAKRRQYDSTLDFNDDVPEEVDEKLGFFGTFVPVFRRNSRWSNRFPVPELGDEKTDMNKVRKFYDFWFDFDSWRDFSMHDEYNLDDAEFREERRWMERQNQSIRKKYQNAERKRIMKLVEAAERLDPRIKAEKEAKEAAKRAEKERRAEVRRQEEEAKRKAEEDKRLKEEQERQEREEKERLEKEQKKQDKQYSKSLRQRLKKALQGKCKLSAVDAEELQDLCLVWDDSTLEDLCVQVEGTNNAEAVLKEAVRSWKQKKEEEKQEQEKQKQAKLEKQKADEAKSAKSASAGEPWTVEELGHLAKGLQKFPGGIGGRWGLITQALNAAGCVRSEAEVIAKTKELSEGQSLRSMGAKVTETFHAAQAAAAEKSGSAKPAAAKAKAAPDLATKVESKEEKPASAEWSAEQQKALEVALQKHPASMDKNERWRCIAEDVPGKTKAQCVERFKFLREQLKK